MQFKCCECGIKKISKKKEQEAKGIKTQEF